MNILWIYVSHCYDVCCTPGARIVCCAFHSIKAVFNQVRANMIAVLSFCCRHFQWLWCNCKSDINTQPFQCDGKWWTLFSNQTQQAQGQEETPVILLVVMTQLQGSRCYGLHLCPFVFDFYSTWTGPRCFLYAMFVVWSADRLVDKHWYLGMISLQSTWLYVLLLWQWNDKFLCIVLWNVTHNVIRYKTIIITEAEGKILEKDIALEKRKWIKKKKKINC